MGNRLPKSDIPVQLGHPNERQWQAHMSMVDGYRDQQKLRQIIVSDQERVDREPIIQQEGSFWRERILPGSYRSIRSTRRQEPVDGSQHCSFPFRMFCSRAIAKTESKEAARLRKENEIAERDSTYMKQLEENLSATHQYNAAEQMNTKVSLRIEVPHPVPMHPDLEIARPLNPLSCSIDDEENMKRSRNHD